MKGRTIYTFTYERLKEFKKKLTAKGNIVSGVELAKEENPNFEKDINYYIDVSNLYKSGVNNIAVELILNLASKNDNVTVLLDENSKRNFLQDFASSIDEIKTIQSVYGVTTKENKDFMTLSSDEFNLLENSLCNELIGHEEFKREFMNKLRKFPLLYKLGEMKIFSLLICGTPGVGKTEFARILHKTMYNDSKMIKINLGNYKTQGAINSLIGSPIGYHGSERGGELSNKLRNSDSKVIIIDEFEKGDTDIFNFFYELLEEGKFTDMVGNEYNLNGYIIIFTTNLTKDNYKSILPEPLLSRFSMKCIFESPNAMQKSKFIDSKINKMIEIYNREIKEPKIVIDEIKKNIDRDTLKHVEDFRVINRMITEALIKVIDEKT